MLFAELKVPWYLGGSFGLFDAMADLITKKGNEKHGVEAVGWVIFLHKGIWHY